MNKVDDGDHIPCTCILLTNVNETRKNNKNKIMDEKYVLGLYDDRDIISSSLFNFSVFVESIILSREKKSILKNNEDDDDFWSTTMLSPINSFLFQFFWLVFWLLSFVCRQFRFN